MSVPAERDHLVLHLVSSVQGRDLETGGDGADDAGDLNHQLARRSHHHSLHPACGGPEQFEHGQHERKRLAAAGGRQQYEVAGP